MAMAVAQERLVEVEADESVVADRRAVGEEKTFLVSPRPGVVDGAGVGGVGFRRGIWRISCLTWWSPARLTFRRSMTLMRRSVAFRRMTRG